MVGQKNSSLCIRSKYARLNNRLGPYLIGIVKESYATFFRLTQKSSDFTYFIQFSERAKNCKTNLKPRVRHPKFISACSKRTQTFRPPTIIGCLDK